MVTAAGVASEPSLNRQRDSVAEDGESQCDVAVAMILRVAVGPRWRQSSSLMDAAEDDPAATEAGVGPSNDPQWPAPVAEGEEPGPLDASVAARPAACQHSCC